MTSTSDKYDVLEEMYRLGASDPRRSVLLQEVRGHLGWPMERFAPAVVELNNDDKWIDVLQSRNSKSGPGRLAALAVVMKRPTPATGNVGAH